MKVNKIICGDALEVLKTLNSESVNCCITSPPYWGLRDYGVEGQLGLEKTPELFVSNLVEVFREVKRVLRNDGTLWLNIGDTYASAKSIGLKEKDLVGIPWMTAFALRADGWYLRSDIIWAKKNCMPESVSDRPTKSHEYVFLLTKSEKYSYDADAIKEPSSAVSLDRAEYGWKSERESVKSMTHGKVGVDTEKMGTRFVPLMANKRTVWNVATHSFKEAHFATFPEKLIEPMVMAGCRGGGLILDPFMGAGTTALVAKKLGRNYLGIELNPAYIDIAEKRLNRVPINMFAK